MQSGMVGAPGNCKFVQRSSKRGQKIRCAASDYQIARATAPPET
jgi:hypothetical protein